MNQYGNQHSNAPPFVEPDMDNGCESGACGLARAFYDSNWRVLVRLRHRGELSKLYISTFDTWAPEEIKSNPGMHRSFSQVLFALVNDGQVLRINNKVHLKWINTPGQHRPRGRGHHNTRDNRHSGGMSHRRGRNERHRSPILQEMQQHAEDLETKAKVHRLEQQCKIECLERQLAEYKRINGKKAGITRTMSDREIDYSRPSGEQDYDGGPMSGIRSNPCTFGATVSAESDASHDSDGASRKKPRARRIIRTGGASTDTEPKDWGDRSESDTEAF